jgi:hypothetical protein
MPRARLLTSVQLDCSNTNYFSFVLGELRHPGLRPGIPPSVFQANRIHRFVNFVQVPLTVTQESFHKCELKTCTNVFLVTILHMLEKSINLGGLQANLVGVWMAERPEKQK